MRLAKFKKEIKSPKTGKISKIDNKLINLLGRILGCPADKGAGIYLYKHLNEKISKGEHLLTLYSESDRKLKEAVDFLNSEEVISVK